MEIPLPGSVYKGVRIRSYHVESYTDYDICLMLTELFLGREDKKAADTLYRIHRLRRANNLGGTQYESSPEETGEGE